jgi:hypothetical protein
MNRGDKERKFGKKCHNRGFDSAGIEIMHRPERVRRPRVRCGESLRTARSEGATSERE